MLKPDQKVMQALSGMNGPLWDTVVEWFNKSYVDMVTKLVRDTESDDRKYRIQQGRGLELFEICKFLKEAEKNLEEFQKRDDRKSGRPIQLETI